MDIRSSKLLTVKQACELLTNSGLNSRAAYNCVRNAVRRGILNTISLTAGKESKRKRHLLFAEQVEIWLREGATGAERWREQNGN
jgi:hypothetical protein